MSYRFKGNIVKGKFVYWGEKRIAYLIHKQESNYSDHIAIYYRKDFDIGFKLTNTFLCCAIWYRNWCNAEPVEEENVPEDFKEYVNSEFFEIDIRKASVDFQ